MPSGSAVVAAELVVGPSSRPAAARRIPRPAAAQLIVPRQRIQRNHPEMKNVPTTEPTTAVSHRLVQLVLIVAGVGVVFWWTGREIAPRLLGIVARIHGLGPAAPLAFMVVYALAVVLLIPASLLTVAAGAVFGFLRGALFALAGATLGSTLAFLLGRHAFRRVVARRLATMPRMAAVERAVSAEGRRIVFLLRLSPLVPFNFLNYALGLTTISAPTSSSRQSGLFPEPSSTPTAAR